MVSCLGGVIPVTKKLENTNSRCCCLVIRGSWYFVGRPSVSATLFWTVSFRGRPAVASKVSEFKGNRWYEDHPARLAVGCRRVESWMVESHQRNEGTLAACLLHFRFRRRSRGALLWSSWSCSPRQGYVTSEYGHGCVGCSR